MLGLDGPKRDVKNPGGELGKKIEALLMDDKDAIVTILAAMSEETAIDVRAGIDK
jgi:hypothetical protein